MERRFSWLQFLTIVFINFILMLLILWVYHNHDTLVYGDISWNLNDSGNWATILSLIWSIITTFGAFLLKSKAEKETKKKLSEQYQSQLKNAYKPNELPPHQYRNNVMVASIGRVGKSVLIKRKSNPRNITDPGVTQNFYLTTAYQRENNGTIEINFCDYKGQTFAQLVAGFIQCQLAPNTDFRYGDINSLIIVVDLFRFNPNEDNLNEPTHITKYPHFHIESGLNKKWKV